MASSKSSQAAKCCFTEKKRLMKEIAKCDFCSDNWEDHHQCLSSAAKASGERSRACVF